MKEVTHEVRRVVPQVAPFLQAQVCEVSCVNNACNLGTRQGIRQGQSGVPCVVLQLQFSASCKHKGVPHHVRNTVAA
jgi:hypothetical protein